MPNLTTVFPSSAYHFWVTLSIDNSFMRGIMARTPFMVTASGSSWVRESRLFFVNEQFRWIGVGVFNCC